MQIIAFRVSFALDCLRHIPSRSLPLFPAQKAIKFRGVDDKNRLFSSFPVTLPSLLLSFYSFSTLRPVARSMEPETSSTDLQTDSMLKQEGEGTTLQNIGILETERVHTLLVFDFDWTMVDDNTDTWVLEKLGASEILKFSDNITWTKMMDKGMSRLYELGVSKEEIENCLHKIPLQSAMARIVRTVSKAQGCEVHIVSDANSFFISVILEKHNLSSSITTIHTNPAHFDDKGALRIKPYLSSVTSPHGCSLCVNSPNMCKGQIVDKLRLERVLPEGRVIFVGDGGNDFCPSTHLKLGDYVLAREGFPLAEKLQRFKNSTQAQIFPWGHANRVESILKELLDL